MPLTLGTQTWDYLNSKDSAHAFYVLGNSTLSEKIYCLGSGIGKPLREYVILIKNLVNPSYVLNFRTVEFSASQVMHLVADISDLTKDTGFIPEVDFEEGIRSLLKESSHEKS